MSTALGQNGFPRSHAEKSRSFGPALSGSLLLGSQNFTLRRWMGLGSGATGSHCFVEYIKPAAAVGVEPC